MEDTQYRFEQEQRTYYLRGMGVLCLALLLFAAGMWRFGEESLQASSLGYNQSMPVYSVDTEDKRIALTFDTDGDEENMAKILGVLKKYDTKATFFVKGTWVDSYPAWVKMIGKEGHDLGNQGNGSANMRKLSAQEQRQEIQAVHDKVKQLTNIEMTLFRPPLGEFDDNVLRTAKAGGYTTVCWSIDSLDWKNYGAESIVDAVINSDSPKNGDIILLHSNAKYTAQALEELIVKLQNAGYQLVPVSELLLDLS